MQVTVIQQFNETHVFLESFYQITTIKKLQKKQTMQNLAKEKLRAELQF